MTLQDYNEGQAWAPMAPPMVPAIPAILQEAIPEVVEEAIEEGGTVFLCKGLFLFFKKNSLARGPLFHFLLFRQFPFF